MNQEERYYSIISYHATLTDILQSVLKNRANSKTGHKIVVFLTLPIESYADESFSFAQNDTIQDLSLNSINSSLLDGKAVREQKKLSSQNLATWLFVMNSFDSGKKTDKVNMSEKHPINDIIKFLGNKGQ